MTVRRDEGLYKRIQVVRAGETYTVVGTTPRETYMRLGATGADLEAAKALVRLEAPKHGLEVHLDPRGWPVAEARPARPARRP